MCSMYLDALRGCILLWGGRSKCLERRLIPSQAADAPPPLCSQWQEEQFQSQQATLQTRVDELEAKVASSSS